MSATFLTEEVKQRTSDSAPIGAEDEFSPSPPTVDHSTPNIVSEDGEEDHFDDVEVTTGEEVDAFSQKLRKRFMDAFRAAKRQQEQKQMARSRPASYSKINSTNRTTLYSRKIKIQKQTEELQARGFADIRTFFPAQHNPETHQADAQSKHCESDGDTEVVEVDRHSDLDVSAENEGFGVLGSKAASSEADSEPHSASDWSRVDSSRDTDVE
ncbi:hypothetical protein M407DRAFT_12985, partial [Tulasnella calospora MUT 4182]